ncbi:N-acetylglutaminylglutamine amidotransferase [Thiospirillum jenense]|uniref:asparagine synthase (glutamine-hydrolyzing) n=1 Tax=Thiospirillum jenense TaxID=1653858 RepID=A0A839HDR2_9GAMM|nr:N-acetylglutaminylglutamine amidotransferase [Thiospirillum jenense]MBB1125317.1 N-acetylglutaminylglutamine amidotransferase [Thiospirillum jenense]
MCGICGELRFDGAPAQLNTIDRMLHQLTRRGPDHAGSYSDGVFSCGQRRLSIIDLSPRSHQPMVDTQLGLVLVFNGTIYNYPELRRELSGRGYRFFSDGDTEVIIKAFHAWGEQCLTRLRGMFAFAIWDMHARSLFLARDRFGIKPLYWSATANTLRFASNTQALLAAGDVDTSIDAIGLHHLLTLHAVVPAPRTILNGIRKLPPAHWLQIDCNGQQTLQRYWQLNATRDTALTNETDWYEAVDVQLTQVVAQHHRIADVPVGVLLSGGLDSSLLVALLAETGADDLRTFSIGFEDTPEEAGNEFIYSDQVVAWYGTQHQRLLIPNAAVLTRLPEAIDAMAEPMFAQDAVAFYLLAEQVAQSIKVVQSGQGADELFGGYFWYPRIAAEINGNAVERLRRHYFDRDHAEYLQLIHSRYAGTDYTGEWVAEQLALPGADELIDAVLRLDVTTFIVDDPVKRVDNMTMAWGLEARVPFLDHELVELVARCPPALKLNDGGKYLLKKIARGRVPDAVIDRPKGYFPMPALKYVRGDFLMMMRDTLMSQACRERGLYQSDYVAQLLAAPEAHYTRIQGNKLWHLALLELWLQRHVDSIA